MSRAIRRRHRRGMSTPHTSSKTQVLVIGAGPTGLVLGAQPLARGISTIGLAETSSTRATGSVVFACPPKAGTYSTFDHQVIPH